MPVAAMQLPEERRLRHHSPEFVREAVEAVRQCAVLAVDKHAASLGRTTATLIALMPGAEPLSLWHFCEVDALEVVCLWAPVTQHEVAPLPAHEALVLVLELRLLLAVLLDEVRRDVQLLGLPTHTRAEHHVAQTDGRTTSLGVVHRRLVGRWCCGCGSSCCRRRLDPGVCAAHRLADVLLGRWEGVGAAPLPVRHVGCLVEDLHHLFGGDAADTAIVIAVAVVLGPLLGELPEHGVVVGLLGGQCGGQHAPLPANELLQLGGGHVLATEGLEHLCAVEQQPADLVGAELLVVGGGLLLLGYHIAALVTEDLAVALCLDDELVEAQLLLAAERHALLDAPLGHQIVHCHGAQLTDAVSTVDGLHVYEGVPVLVKHDHVVGRHQIDAQPPGSCGDEVDEVV
mmetsp:Transcript_3811/g.9543  ORF Transcript_3811/g.9543 Transcript_3811/m.9543 type:complete len:400 (+) Transcript_3811:1348-2547(+)